MTKTTTLKMNSYLVTFKTQADIDRFMSDNFVDPTELKCSLEVGKTYKVVDDEAYGWWIELAD